MVDLSKHIVMLAMEILGVTMLEQDFKLLSGQPSKEVLQFFENLDIVSRELAHLQISDPFRRFCFWIPDVKKSFAAPSDILLFCDKVLKDYSTLSSSKDKNEFSVLDSLLKSDYNSDIERAADAFALMFAALSIFELKVYIIVLIPPTT